MHGSLAFSCHSVIFKLRKNDSRVKKVESKRRERRKSRKWNDGRSNLWQQHLSSLATSEKK